MCQGTLFIYGVLFCNQVKAKCNFTCVFKIFRNSSNLRAQPVASSNNIQEEADETTPLIINPRSTQKEQKASKGGPSLVAVVMKHWLPILSVVCKLIFFDTHLTTSVFMSIKQLSPLGDIEMHCLCDM